MINGYDSLNITKLDVLDELPEIKVGIKYLVDGKELPGFPGLFLSCTMCQMLNEACQPISMS
jgi:adenylosuccinate synthase